MGRRSEIERYSCKPLARSSAGSGRFQILSGKHTTRRADGAIARPSELDSKAHEKNGRIANIARVRVNEMNTDLYYRLGAPWLRIHAALRMFSPEKKGFRILTFHDVFEDQFKSFERL